MRLNLDVLLILDALDTHGSFATAAESLYKTPAALSYMIQKLESDLDITLLDRSGHRAKFTDTGRMVLEKGRLLINAAKDLEKQAVQLEAGWERDLAIALDASFPFERLLPLIDAFYAQNPQTRLNFTHHTLAGSWEELTRNGADIMLGAINEPPTSAEWSWKMVGALDNVFVVAPAHLLAEATQPLNNKQLSLHRAVVISDSARYCHPLNSNLLAEQPQIRVDDFASKVALLRAGLGCGFLPRHIAQPWLENGELIEKPVLSCREKDLTYIAWRSDNDGLAQRWWREAILRDPFLNQLYS
ncbi:LysR family transcriptional regulator [Raoultella ornithinolytica]|uniref:LysR substrate-binding domain-containing protein n=1 Tax=Raoultella ornithinolytica TaxID=54291 RepID=UPI0015DCCA3E|nr:LysR substrate-binding domain-containing protein [Raoultella ornithinolytica]EJD6650533.1 LysR family transcriptional regulator [Raoultella ornithinolytica]ELV3660272.1 LysR family transcriptional regulator [Raoultella ornithinolytica]BBJ87816.1 LysR family transcriptional regulator [Raoultella ornithinolytica]BBT86752.1 LysR family transcriptional regulator [Raoultella ornithinolytica]